MKRIGIDRSLVDPRFSQRIEAKPLEARAQHYNALARSLAEKADTMSTARLREALKRTEQQISRFFTPEQKPYAYMMLHAAGATLLQREPLLDYEKVSPREKYLLTTIFLTILLLLLANCANPAATNVEQPQAEPTAALVEEMPEGGTSFQETGSAGPDPEGEVHGVSVVRGVEESIANLELGFIENTDSTTFSNPQTGETFFINTSGDYYENANIVAPNPDGSETFVELPLTHNVEGDVITLSSKRVGIPYLTISYENNTTATVTAYFPDGSSYSKTFEAIGNGLLRKQDQVQAKLASSAVELDPTEVAPDQPTDENELPETDADATAEAKEELPKEKYISAETGKNTYQSPLVSEYFGAFRTQEEANTGKLPIQYYYMVGSEVKVSTVGTPEFFCEDIVYTDLGEIESCTPTKLQWTDSDTGQTHELVWTPDGWGNVQFEGDYSRLVQTTSTINPGNPIFYVEGTPEKMRELGLDQIWNPNSKIWVDSYETHAFTREPSEIIANQESGSSILDAQFLVFKAVMVYGHTNLSNSQITSLKEAIDNYQLTQNEENRFFNTGSAQIDLTNFVFGGKAIDLTKKSTVVLGGQPGGHSILPNNPLIVNSDGSLSVHMLAPEKISTFGQAMIAVFSRSVYDVLNQTPDVKDSVPIFRIFGDHSMGMVGDPGNRIVVFPILPD